MSLIFEAARSEFRKLGKPINEAEFRLMQAVEAKRMNINLHIDRLVLNGLSVSHADRPYLQAAIEAELVRLLSNGGVHPGFQGGGALPTIRAGDIQLATNNNPNALGQQIAGALYGGIGRE